MTPGGPLDPLVIMMASAIAALWAWGQWSVKGRVEHCEAREDKLLAADIEKTAALKELTSLAAGSGDLTEKAIGMIAGGVLTLNDNNKKLDQALAQIALLSKATGRMERDTARDHAQRKNSS